jgi:hypothetical protein
MTATNKSVQKKLKKEILSTKDSDIDKAIENSFSTIKKETKRKRLLEVAVQRNPEKYLKEFYETYSSNKQELKDIFNNIKFTKSKYMGACMALVREITPYPQILLSKIGSDERMQEMIKEEVKRGVCPKYYLNYLADNQNIILEPEVQEKVYEILIQENPLDLASSRYLDLNSRKGLEFINSIDDIAIAYGILKRNIWGIEEDNKGLINMDTLIAYKLHKGINLYDEEMEVISNFLDGLLLEISFRQHILKVKKYVNLLSDMIVCVNCLSFGEQCSRFIREQNIKCSSLEVYLATKKSELQYEYWISDIHTADLTQKHAISKEILVYYPEKVCDFLIEIKAENNDTLYKNVQVMIDNLKIDLLSDDSENDVDNEDNENLVVNEEMKKIMHDERRIDLFDGWSYEDTEDELFKDFIQKK